MPAFITGLGACLPNHPVANDQIESVLGMVNGRPSRVKRIVLGRNGIHSRYYARDPRCGQTHTNAQMTAEAIRAMARQQYLSLDEIDVLACGTSSPDQMIPSHASMVHGALACPPCEVVATSGVCCSGMSAMKYAYMAVASGAASTAVATGSELSSSWLQANAFHLHRSEGSPEDDPYVSFEQEFLRWMLSDGAGAVCISHRPRAGGLSLRVDWLDLVSFANELETCMYCGGVKKEGGRFFSWRELDTFDDVWKEGYLNLTQDVRLLKDSVVPVGFRHSFQRVRDKHHMEPQNIDWFLPHLSSEYFRQPVADTFAEEGFVIPQEKWFTNLAEKGNTGSASIFIMLEELWASGRLARGDRVFCGVPESARFTYAYMHLTAV
jgi:3-oxoacyl-[acyl-carrier-protein] synthase III